MGYAPSAAIGAKVGNPDRLVIDIDKKPLLVWFCSEEFLFDLHISVGVTLLALRIAVRLAGSRSSGAFGELDASARFTRCGPRPRDRRPRVVATLPARFLNCLSHPELSGAGGTRCSRQRPGLQRVQKVVERQ